MGGKKKGGGGAVGGAVAVIISRSCAIDLYQALAIALGVPGYKKKKKKKKGKKGKKGGKYNGKKYGYKKPTGGGKPK
jgi:hypothetical protein